MFLKCIFKSLTGYDCPFCGAQRAFKSIMEGDMVEAFNYNPFLFIISPYLILVILSVLNIIPEKSRLRKILYNRWVIAAAGCMTILWGIIRNIDIS